MEEMYLYPGEGFSPIAEAGQWSEYYLSDVLSLVGDGISNIRLLFSFDRSFYDEESDQRVKNSGRYVVVVCLSSGKYVVLAPLNLHHNLFGRGVDNSTRVWNVNSYKDARIRYYRNSGGSVFRPVWVSLVRTDGGEDVSIGPEIEYPYTQLSGNLVSDVLCDRLVDSLDTTLCIEKFFG